MRDGIGSIFLYNIIIVFILLVFAFLAATMSYNKAFYLNSRVVASIERFEGYNQLSAKAIIDDMNSIGYRRSGKGNTRCPKKEGKDAMTLIGGDTYEYCIYKFWTDPTETGHNHYRYGVITFISFDFPFVDVVFNLPIYTKTDSMYLFQFGGN